MSSLANKNETENSFKQSVYVSKNLIEIEWGQARSGGLQELVCLTADAHWITFSRGCQQN